MLTIQPKALARVFVFFCPGPAPPEVATVLNKPVATGLIWDATGAKRDATGVRIEFEVYVRCRLVKDFQKVPHPELLYRLWVHSIFRLWISTASSGSRL